MESTTGAREERVVNTPEGAVVEMDEKELKLLAMPTSHAEDGKVARVAMALHIVQSFRMISNQLLLFRSL